MNNTNSSVNRPAVADGELLSFVSLKRRFFFDPRLNATMVWVGQGDFYVTQNPNEVLTTILGSCVAVCVRDPEMKIGGINHFLLPEAGHAATASVTNDLRYGSYSIERLVNTIMTHGGRREKLEIKIFGAASISVDYSQIGEKNASFVEAYFDREGLPVSAKDLRGSFPRRLVYYPSSGKALIAYTRDSTAKSIFDMERKLASSSAADTRPTKPILY
jgi:chemotaxis protein CheD